MRTKLVVVSVKHSRGRAQAIVMARVLENGACVISEEVMQKLLVKSNVARGDTFTM